MSLTVTLGTLSITFTEDDVREAYKQPQTNKYDPDNIPTVILCFIITNEPSNERPSTHHQPVDKERIHQLTLIPE